MANIYLFLFLITIIILAKGDDICRVESEVTTPKALERTYYYNRRTDVYVHHIWCRNISFQTGTSLITENEEFAQKARDIRFVHCDMQTITTRLMHALVSLEEVFIDDNNVEEIEPGAFSNLPLMTNLNLENNNIKIIHYGSFNGLFKLSSLNLANNSIVALNQNSFKDLHQLRQLNLSKNKINLINESCFVNLKELRGINLSYNNISVLDAKIFSCNIKLTKIFLNDNRIFKIHSDIFTNTTSLANLYLSNNNLSELNFEKLQGNISLSNNNFESITKVGFAITYLDLSFNAIKVLPSNIFEKSKVLSHLLLSNNRIEQIHDDALVGLNTLQVLHLQNNHIRNIDIGTFRDLKNLLILNLSSNHLENLEFGFFTGLGEIRKLDLANNKISHLDVSVLFPLQKLEMFQINENFISSFDILEFITHLKYIRFIGMDGNNWKCKWLTNTIHIFNQNNITVFHATSLKVKNVHGISCNENSSKVNITKSSDINIRKDLIKTKSTETQNKTSTQDNISITTTEAPTTITLFKQIKTATRDNVTITTSTQTPLTTLFTQIETKIGDNVTITKSTETTKLFPQKYRDTENTVIKLDIHNKSVKNFDNTKNEILKSNIELKHLLVFIASLLCLSVIVQLVMLHNTYKNKKNNRSLGHHSNISESIPSCTIELLSKECTH